MVLSTITAGIIMAVLGTVLAFVIAVAHKKLSVHEDLRTLQVEALLPRVDCGACGTPACRTFAEEVVRGNFAPGRCTVNPPEKTEKIARFLGVDPGAEEKRIARLACAGGTHVARFRARYEGLQTCRAAALVSGGGKGCAWGCLGLGDCAVVCEFSAITMDAHGLPMVDSDKCTACGDCVEVCPKGLFSLHPLSHRLWVACKNLSLGDQAEAECEVACNGCAHCAEDAPEGLIRIEDNLAVVNYELNQLASEQHIQRCPTGAIVWLNGPRETVRGNAAKRIPAGQSMPRLKEPAGLR